MTQSEIEQKLAYLEEWLVFITNRKFSGAKTLEDLKRNSAILDEISSEIDARRNAATLPSK